MGEMTHATSPDLVVTSPGRLYAAAGHPRRIASNSATAASTSAFLAFLLLRCSKRQRHGNSYNYASTDEADKFCQGGEEIRAEEEWLAREA